LGALVIDKVGRQKVVSMSVVRDLILQADDQLRYPTGGELRSMVEFLSTVAQPSHRCPHPHRQRKEDR